MSDGRRTMPTGGCWSDGSDGAKHRREGQRKYDPFQNRDRRPRQEGKTNAVAVLTNNLCRNMPGRRPGFQGVNQSSGKN